MSSLLLQNEEQQEGPGAAQQPSAASARRVSAWVARDAWTAAGCGGSSDGEAGSQDMPQSLAVLQLRLQAAAADVGLLEVGTRVGGDVGE